MSAIFYSNIESSAEITTGSELYKVPQNKTSTVVINATNTDANDDYIRIAIKDYDKQIAFDYEGTQLDSDFSSANYGQRISDYNISVSSGDLSGIVEGTSLTFSGGSTAKVLKSYESFVTTNIVVTEELIDVIEVDSMSNFAVDDQLTQNSDVAVIVGTNPTLNYLYVQYTQGGPFISDYQSVGEIQTFETYGGTTIIGEADQTYTDVSSATNGSGIDATFTISRDSNGDISSVVITNGGTGYAFQDTVVIDGADIGGTTIVDDLAITVLTIDPAVDGSITSNNSGSALITSVVNDVQSLFFNGLYASGFEINAGEIIKFDISGSGLNGFNIYSDENLTSLYSIGVSIRGYIGTSNSFVTLQVTDSTPNSLYFGDASYGFNNKELTKGLTQLTGNKRNLLLYDVSGTIVSSETFTYNSTEYTVASVDVGAYGRINRYVSAIDELKVFVDYGSFVEGSLLLSPLSDYYYAINQVYNLKKEDHIEFDRSLYGNGSFQRSAIVLDSEFSVVVNSNSGNTIFNVYGFEE